MVGTVRLSWRAARQRRKAADNPDGGIDTRGVDPGEGAGEAEARRRRRRAARAAVPGLSHVHPAVGCLCDTPRIHEPRGHHLGRQQLYKSHAYCSHQEYDDACLSRHAHLSPFRVANGRRPGGACLASGPSTTRLAGPLLLMKVCDRDSRFRTTSCQPISDRHLRVVHRGSFAAGGNSAAKSWSVRLRQLAHPSPSLASPPAGW